MQTRVDAVRSRQMLGTSEMNILRKTENNISLDHGRNEIIRQECNIERLGNVS